MTRYCLTIFLSAFLLFQVQPLIARYILPWYGGSPAVWTTCMLFFQSLLLLGYAYAHGIVRWWTPRVQCVMHSAALVATLFVLPIAPRSEWKPTEAADPTWHILLLLSLCVGAPYVLLSSTTPLIQSWFSRTHAASSPYRLYALSNVGSLLGLLTYPLLVERFMPLELQANLWSVSYAVFAVLCVASAVQLLLPGATSVTRSWQVDAGHNLRADQTPACAKTPGVAVALLWLSLACCGSVILLATTNVMCRDVASVPFLWVLPLALYLLSFIVCFDREQWYKRDLFGVLLIASVSVHVALCYYRPETSVWLQIAHFSFLLTVCCFICHGELVRLKPAARFLTHFYLSVSAGGALGGVLVTLVAPAVLPDYYELNAAIGACVVLLLLMYRLDRWQGMDGVTLRADIRITAGAGVIALIAVALITWAMVSGTTSGVSGSIISMKRNFYGVLKVYSRFADTPENCQIIMAHGTTVHGFQFQDKRKRQVPTSYYARQSGIGVAIDNHPQYVAGQRPIRLGVIGLGTGTLACYARAGDYVRFYEIDPAVVELSDKHFTFQQDARRRGADVEVYLGDARIVMERQLARGATEQFDILAVDAFSSDAIPVHLLTWECFEVYARHVKQDGVIAFHVSNRHLDLAPVVRKLAERGRRQSLLMRLRPTPSEDKLPTSAAGASDWILVTNNDQFIHNTVVQDAHTPWRPDAWPPVLWTDDFSNLFQVLGRSE